MDFDMMLVSVLPHKYFVNFLQEDQRQHLPYLQIIHIYKLYLNELETLQTIENALNELSDITSSFVTVSTTPNKHKTSSRSENRRERKLLKEKATLLAKI